MARSRRSKASEDTWKEVTAWCRECWWKLEQQFHCTATKREMEKAFQRLHDAGGACKKQVKVVEPANGDQLAEL